MAELGKVDVKAELTGDLVEPPMTSKDELPDQGAQLRLQEAALQELQRTEQEGMRLHLQHALLQLQQEHAKDLARPVGWEPEPHQGEPVEPSPSKEQPTKRPKLASPQNKVSKGLPWQPAPERTIRQPPPETSPPPMRSQPFKSSLPFTLPPPPPLPLPPQAQVTAASRPPPPPGELRVKDEIEDTDKAAHFEAFDEKEEHTAELREMARLKAEADELRGRITAATARANGRDEQDAGVGEGGASGSPAVAGNELMELAAQVSVLERQVAAFEGCRGVGQAGGGDVADTEPLEEGDGDSDTEGSSGDEKQTPKRRTREARPEAAARGADAAMEQALDDLMDFAESDWASVFAEGYELLEESAWKPAQSA